MPTLIELTVIAFRVVAVGTLLIVIVKCAFDFWRAESGRGVVLLKCLAALAVWFLISTGMASMFFGAVAYSADGSSGGGAPDGSGLSNPRAAIVLLLVIYAAACSSLSYWVLRRAEARSLS
jgi:hypothetical protein